MKRKIKRIISAILTIIMCAGTAVPVNAATSDLTNLGKIVDSYASQEGTFTLSTSSRFFVVADSEPTGALLQTVQLVQRQFAVDEKPSSTVLDIVWGPEDWAKDGDIVVKLDALSGIEMEGYTLNVASKATTTASDVDGLLYGLNMLHKYLRVSENNTLSGFTASDTPDTKERTVMLDCGRKYYTKDYICNFIREISWMGYNTIELHFAEDGGFRMDFWGIDEVSEDKRKDGYDPKNDFSWICGSLPQDWVNPPYDVDCDKGRYLTTPEIVEILEMAKMYHIDVIPSFDSPAHCDFLTWQFEQNYKENENYEFVYNSKTYKAKECKGCINYTGITGGSNSNWPDYAALNIAEDSVGRAFAFALYEDIADFFSVYAGSTKFNICADEVVMEYSNTWDYDAFPEYVNKLDDILNLKGYTTRIFNDFIGKTDTKTYNITNFNSDIEILYWNSPFNPNSGSTSSEPIEPVMTFAKNGRTVYNVIQTNTYYCTRVTSEGADARNPDNTTWSIYHSNEQDIYNEWYPADISEHGKYSENIADITENLGGGYFCIWNDYAALNTEVEIWNGAYDIVAGKTYYLLDRMWSNTIKQWNWDVNKTVSFDTFKNIRDAFGYFPGGGEYDSEDGYATSVFLPASTDIMPDHSELEALLLTKLPKDKYTEESYGKYERAFVAAEAVNVDVDATMEQIKIAINELKEAEATLGEKITFECKVVGKVESIRTLEAATVGLKFYIYVPPMTGYEFESVSGATYTALASKDGSGFISGTKSADKDVVIWYTNVPSTTRLEEVIAETPALDQSSYTASSWSAYQTALAAATGFSVDSNTMQSDVDAKVKALTDALTGLVTNSSETKFVEIVKLTPTAHLGKQVGLKITTSPDVATITVSGEELTLCTGRVQTLSSGEIVKIWLVNFPADEAGTFEYTVTATGASGTVSETVSITVN